MEGEVALDKHDIAFSNTVLSRDVSNFSWNGTRINGPTNYTSDTCSFWKERWWETQVGGPPYKGTRDYEVQYFKAKNQSYLWTEVDSAYIGGNYRTHQGVYAAVTKDVALGMTYSPGLSNLSNKLVTEAKNACFDTLGGVQWNTPVFFAELNKTGELVFQTAKKIDSWTRQLLAFRKNPRDLLRKMKKAYGKYARGFRVPPEQSTTVATLWLQWRYAVQTTLLDVQEAARTTADLLVDKTNRPTVVITSNRSGVVNLGDEHRADNEWGRAIGVHLSLGEYVHHYLTRVGQVHVKAWIKAYRSNSFLTDANQLGWLNLPVIAWELTPLSFVADWFLDIGNYLQRLSNAVGYTVSEAGFQVLRKVTGEHRVWASLFLGKYVTRSFDTGRDGAMYEAFRYNRYAWPDTWPTWNPAIRMNSNRFADAAALLRLIPFGKFRLF